MSFHTLKFDLKKSFKDNVSKSSVKPASLIKSVASSFGTFGDRVTNSNHRHDEKHEIEADEKREADKEKNRFQSFAPEIENNDVKWFIGGHDYMAAVAQAIEAAEYEVLILDWWLNPELYLIRPGFLHEKWRLDRCLGRAAERGCDIRIIMYKEVEKALVLKSKHSKHTLEALHPNIKVMRHPDHTLLEGMSATLFWAHHEKLLLVDRRKAFVGGIDLCYGRWDLNYHPIADYHPELPDAEVFAGQEYNNVRIQDFNDIDKPFNDGIDRSVLPRMGWHDVAIQINGPVCVSLETHFIERWEFLRVFKYLSRPKYIPIELGIIRHQPIKKHGTLDKVNTALQELNIKDKLSEKKDDYVDPHKLYDEKYHIPDKDEERAINMPHPGVEESFVGPVKAQICRSISDWSHGFLIEKSIQNAYIKTIKHAKHSVYIENQFFIAGGEELKDGRFRNFVGDAIVERIVRAAQNNEKFRVIVVIPAIPGFPGDIKGDDAVGIRAIMNYQYISINRGGHSILERIKAAGYNPNDYIRFFHLRSYDRILPKPDASKFKAIHYDETSNAKMDRAQRYKDYILDGIKEGKKDTIADLAMQSTARVSEQGWAFKTNEAEQFVSELLYIHSKLIIVDDDIILCGSANINDRSLTGDHDSEICVVIEEPREHDAIINGESVKVSKSAASLRRGLIRKHLGLVQPQTLIDDLGDKFRPAMKPLPEPYEYDFGSEEDQFVEDPLSDTLWDYIQSTAEQNAEVFEELFNCYPTNKVKNWKEYEVHLKEVSRPCHVVNKYLNDPKTIREKLDNVRGYIVPMAHEFLIEENSLVKNGIQYNDFVSDLYA